MHGAFPSSIRLSLSIYMLKLTVSLNYKHNLLRPKSGLMECLSKVQFPLLLLVFACGFKSHLNIHGNIVLETAVIEAEFNGPHKGKGHAISLLIASQLGHRTQSHSSFWV